jgi:anthranilate phosphoribosyltransferase
MDIKKAIDRIVQGKDLTQAEMHSVFNAIMSGRATSAQIGSFITALRIKGETVDEITGAARVMREKALKIEVGTGVVLDTCGTGGTGTKVFNVSTASAFVLAGCGVKVAKHGNRAASSSCGSADVLEELGVNIALSRKATEKAVKNTNIGFMFAPLFHGAMKNATGPRKDIGIRTIFNLLGPLCNPASAKYQVMGVYDGSLTEVIAKVLKKLGAKRAFVVHGAGPLDEVSLVGRTKVSELKNGKVRTFYLSPKDFGFKKACLKDIQGGSSKKNAAIIKNILKGKEGPARDIVLMNAALALVACGKSKSVKNGVKQAAISIDSGKAMEKLEQLINVGKKK